MDVNLDFSRCAGDCFDGDDSRSKNSYAIIRVTYYVWSKYADNDNNGGCSGTVLTGIDISASKLGYSFCWVRNKIRLLPKMAIFHRHLHRFTRCISRVFESEVLKWVLVCVYAAMNMYEAYRFWSKEKIEVERGYSYCLTNMVVPACTKGHASLIERDTYFKEKIYLHSIVILLATAAVVLNAFISLKLLALAIFAIGVGGSVIMPILLKHFYMGLAFYNIDCD